MYNGRAMGKLKSILKIMVQGFGLLSVLKTKKQGLWYVVNDTKTYFFKLSFITFVFIVEFFVCVSF